MKEKQVKRLCLKEDLKPVKICSWLRKINIWVIWFSYVVDLKITNSAFRILKEKLVGGFLKVIITNTQLTLS